MRNMVISFSSVFLLILISCSKPGALTDTPIAGCDDCSSSSIEIDGGDSSEKERSSTTKANTDNSSESDKESSESSESKKDTDPSDLVESSESTYKGLDPAPHTAPGIIEAEAYQRVANESKPINEGGYDNGKNDGVDMQQVGSIVSVGWFEPGEELDYDVAVETPGLYTLSANVAGNKGAANLTIKTEGENVQYLSFDPTGGWQNFVTHSIDVWIEESTSTIVVGTETGQLSFDNFSLVYKSSVKPSEINGSGTSSNDVLHEIESSNAQVSGDPLEGYTLLWSDEFEGNQLNMDNWVYEEGNGTQGWGNWELQYYSRNNVSVQNGNLIIEAKPQITADGCGDGASTWECKYTSGKITTQGKKSFKYGRIEARMKLPVGQGMWPAFWMLGDNFPEVSWPRCGELDIMEGMGRFSNFTSGAIHSGTNWMLGPERHTFYYHEPNGPHNIAEDFHVYTVVWDNESIVWYIDDVKVYETGKDKIVGDGSPEFHPFSDATDHKFYFLFNFAVGGMFDDYRNPFDGFQSEKMFVDWVRVYKPN